MNELLINTRPVAAESASWAPAALSALPTEARTQETLRLLVYGAHEAELVLDWWRELEAELDSVPLACSVGWTETWLNVYAETVRPWFIVGCVAGRVCGICLLTESRTRRLLGMPLPTLHLGTAGEPRGESVCVEYNDLLVKPEYRHEFSRQLLKLMLQEPAWSELHLEGIPALPAESGPLLEAAQSAVEQQADSAIRQRPLQLQVRERECRYFDLQAARETDSDILSQLGRSTRSNLKRRLKQVGSTQVEWAESASQATDIFTQLVELHQARWNSVGQPGAFASGRFLRFQQEWISHAWDRGEVALARVQANGETMGCLYFLVDRGRLLDYVSGFADFQEFGSPGLLSHYLCMEEALKRDYIAYDFLVGEKRHKENLGKSQQVLQWVTCTRPNWKHNLHEKLRAGKHLVRNLLSRNKTDAQQSQMTDTQ